MEIRHTPFDEGTRLELCLEGKAVSGLSVHDLTLRIGERTVRCGGIGGVGTPNEHRMKGYARQILDASITFMQDEGYHLAALYGIPSFYTRWGFAPAMPECRVTIKTRDAELAPSRFQVRPMTREDAPSVGALYAAANATRTGTVVRPEDWAGFKRGPGWTSRFGAFVAEDDQGVAGYAMYTLDQGSLEVGEVGYRDRSVWSTLLAEVGRIAWDRRLEELTILGPFDDPFFAYCQRYGCSITLAYPRNAHCMARVINQDALVETLAPLLRRRATEAGMGGADALMIETELGRTRLSLDSEGETWRFRLPQWALAQLVLGYRSVDDQLFETEAHTDPGAIPLLEAIFPVGYPYTYTPDRY